MMPQGERKTVTVAGLLLGLTLLRGVGDCLPAAWAQEELFVTNTNPDSGDSVTVYARTASGDTAPLRTLSGALTGLNGPAFIAVTLPITLAAAVLPTERTALAGGPAVTAFGTILNGGLVLATGCAIAPITVVPATFTYQTTDATDALTGTPNTPADIPAGQGQNCVFAFAPAAPFPVTEIQLSFACTNSAPAPITPGVNTFRLRATATPAPDPECADPDQCGGDPPLSGSL